MAKILLVSTPYTINYLSPDCSVEHLGLSYLSGYLRYFGHETVIIDANTPSNNYSNLLKISDDYDIIGFTIFTTNLNSTKNAILMLRNNGYHGHITLGGHLVSLVPDYIHEIKGTDSIIVGEGEKTLTELAFSIDSNKPWKRLKGIIYKNGTEKKLFVNPSQPLIQDLDFNFYPDREPYCDILKKNKFASISSSRGCNGKCSYCSISQFYSCSNGSKWRARSPKNILSEIQFLVNKYNVKDFVFVDDNFIPNTMSVNRAIEIAEGINAVDNNIGFSIEFRPYKFTINTIEILSKNSLRSIYLGLESSIKRQQELYRKYISVDNVKEIVSNCKLFNVYPSIFTIFIDPWVTLDEIKGNLEFVDYIGPEYFHDITAYLRPIPGTPIYEYIMKKGFMDVDHPIVRNSKYYINTKFVNNSTLVLLHEWLLIRDTLENKYAQEMKHIPKEVIMEKYRDLKKEIFVKCSNIVDRL